jgi:hypothetical protein
MAQRAAKDVQQRAVRADKALDASRVRASIVKYSAAVRDDALRQSRLRLTQEERLRGLD